MDIFITSKLFPLWAVVNNAAVNLQVQVVVWTKIFNFLGTMPGSGIAGSYGDSGFNLLRNFPTVSQSSCIILHSHQECVTVPIFPHPQLHLLLPVFFIMATLVGVRYVSVWLQLVFPDDKRPFFFFFLALLSASLHHLRPPRRGGTHWAHSAERLANA